MDVKDLSPHHRTHNKKEAREQTLAKKSGAYGGFIRMSHEYSVERGSIENHKLEIARLAEVRGFQLKEWYILPAVSGKTIWNHPEVLRMRRDIESGKIAGIVFTKLARLCRNMGELIQFRDFFEAHQAQMVCPEFSTGDAQGKMFYVLLSMMAEWERETIAERVKASVRPRAERGQNLGGRTKYGFRWVKNVVDGIQISTIEQYPEEIKIIRFILEMFFKHQSYKATARAVSKTYPTRAGFKWSDSRTREMLTNPIYRGAWVRNRTTNRDGKVLEKSEADWVIQSIKPVFTPEEAERIDQIIATISSRMTKPVQIQKYLFTHITCGCGARVYGARLKKSPSVYRCRKCANQIPVEEMDNLMLTELRSIHRNGNQIAKLNDQLKASTARHQSLIDQATRSRQDREAIESRIGALMQNEAGLPAPAVKREVIRLQAQVDALNAKIMALEAEAEDCVQITDITAFLEWIKGVPDLLEEMGETRAKYQLVASLLPKIVLGRETIEYEINLLRHFPAIYTKQQRTLVDSLQLPSVNFSKIRLDDSIFHPQTPLSRRLRWAREYLRLDQKTLAKRWKKSVATIGNWELSRSLPGSPADKARVLGFIAHAREVLSHRLQEIRGGSK